MTLSKGFLIVSITCCAGLFGYKYLVADPPGYCRSQNRYIPDEEFIRTVIPIVQRDIARRKPQKNDSSFYSDWDEYIPKTDDYSCCRVERNETYSAFNRIFNRQRISVAILPPPKKSGVVKFYFDVCGTLKDSYIGWPAANSDPITTTQYRR